MGAPKLFIWAVLIGLLASQSAFAALRVSNSAVSTGGNDTVTVTDNGSVAGDQLTLYVLIPGSESIMLSSVPPSFTQFAVAYISGLTRGISCTIIALSGTTRASSYSITVAGGNGTTPAIIFAANSGRTTGTPTAYWGTSDTSGNNGSGSPVSVALGGVTATAGADLLWIGAVNLTPTGTTWTFTPPSGLTSQQTANIAGAGASGSLNLSSENAVSAGATGTLTGSAAQTSGSADFAGIVVALPIAGSSVSPSQFFLASSALQLAALPWVIERRRRLAPLPGKRGT